MDSAWFSSALAEEVMNNPGIFSQTQNIVTDIISNKLPITQFVENIGTLLTNKEIEHREAGMRFLTKVLTELPKLYLSGNEIKFLSKFYADRLKDNHRVVPPVLEGYAALIDMEKYDVALSAEFFTELFREVTCQSQVRQDRYIIYSIMKKIMDKDIEYVKSLGPDFIYGVISAIDGERDPRNLLFIFNFLPNFISRVPLGHLQDEMFDVISCYFPIDFNPSPNDPAAVTRQDLANALAPCLCAIPAFGSQCLVLLIEKLDSALQVAKLDSLRLLTESCKTFDAETYGPFLKALWSSIRREIMGKSDEATQMAAHEALSALVKKLSTAVNTDRSFETFIEGIMISMQAAIAESATVIQFIQATRVLSTTANASKESCFIITAMMIPSIIAFYGFKTTKHLQICSLKYLAELYELAKHWDILDKIKNQVKEIPQHCLTAVSSTHKEYQITGFKTLLKTIDELDTDLVVPFVEILVHNVQFSQDTELLSVSVETIHHIAKRHPELIMNTVVKGKCDVNNLTATKSGLQERLNLLSNLLSIDDFTKIIIEEMLFLIKANDEEAPKVIEALSESISNSYLCSDEKVTQIESDHNLLGSVMKWLIDEMEAKTPLESLTHGHVLISNTMSSLPPLKQLKILQEYTDEILRKSKSDEMYFLTLESLYNSLHKSVFNDNFTEIMKFSLDLSVRSSKEVVGTKACALVAHFLNKAEYGSNFEVLYECLKTYLPSCCGKDIEVCPRLIRLYGWLTKALLLRGSDHFLFWLQKIIVVLSNSEFSKYGVEAIRLIVSSEPEHFTPKQHCRISLLYRQRLFTAFSNAAENPEKVPPEVKEYYLQSWAFVIGKAPKMVLDTEVSKVAPIVIESLASEDKDVLIVMLEVLNHFVSNANKTCAGSLQTILPRVLRLSMHSSMDIRMKSLQCIYDIANAYPTALLLPHKQDIIALLAPSLDDKKRLVRNMAVRARSRWYLVGAPGEPKSN